MIKMVDAASALEACARLIASDLARNKKKNASDLVDSTKQASGSVAKVVAKKIPVQSLPLQR
jgi:hypothetical protein